MLPNVVILVSYFDTRPDIDTLNRLEYETEIKAVMLMNWSLVMRNLATFLLRALCIL